MVKKFIKKLTPKFALSAYHYILALLGAVIFACLPAGRAFSKNLTIIGVTGTSGKSTTCDFLTRILEEGGNKVASISTIRFKVGEKEWENKYKMTMPGRFVIQKFLRQARKAGCKFVVLEVTSEGIRQFRHKFITFDTAVFTNLGREHLESHGGFENYRNEKLKLFAQNRSVHVINADDENAKYFLDVHAGKKITFSIKDAKDLKEENSGLLFDLNGARFILPVAGIFNVMNALAAVAVAQNYKIHLKICAQALAKIKTIPGRMEVVAESPRVIVDYAHTPEQLESVYKSLSHQPYPLNSKLICVLGSCGGGRDKWKRPVLGEIAKKYCKEVIVTDEDPYDEDPMEIINQVAETAGEKAIKILDRREAIARALKLANKEDIVIITGKGSEPWMCAANGKKIPWDDREIVKELILK